MSNRPPLMGSWVLRQGAAVAGAIVVTVGAGLPWLANFRAHGSDAALDVSPFHLNLKWLFSGSSGIQADPVKSIGMLLLVLVGLIVFGLVTPGKGVTLFAGAAAAAAAAAFVFTVLRSPRPLLDTVGWGVYVTLLGGGIAVAGTLLGAGPHHHHRR
ncbi:MAG: hypothetical protein LC722_03185 [Actinobacteria bacterium]|nr:hypothetical protein [Actinomycetota bacterium]